MAREFCGDDEKERKKCVSWWEMLLDWERCCVMCRLRFNLILMSNVQASSREQ